VIREGTLLKLISSELREEPAVEDGQLVRAQLAGESWAATTIWNRHAPMIYRLFDRALGHPKDVDDMTHEVFYRAFASLRTIKDHTALRPFLYSTAVNILKWELRKRRVRRTVFLSETGHLPDGAVDGDDTEARAALGRFHVLLDRLGTNDRTAFVLRQVGGLSFEEVVAAMGGSMSTAKRRVARASQEMSRLIENDPDLAVYLDRRGAKS
jgi:RNA polymerase sigma-70 factor, ECF subfamily